MKISIKIFTALLLVSLAMGASGTALAASAINLGTAANFAVLGGSTVTNTGPTVINGDLGLSPGTSVTGFPPGIVNGVEHVTDAVAAQAQSDLVAAYNSASGQTGAVIISGNLGGQTLTPGIYNSASSLGLTGTLVLDGQGNPDAVFIFQIGSALTTASASNVNLINGAQACNVFWQVGTSATLGTNSNFVGSILALSSVTVTTGAVINGRVLARNGAVTLDANSITKPACAVTVVAPTLTPTATSSSATFTPTLTTTTQTPVSTSVLASIAASAPAATTALSMPIPGLPNTGVNPSSPAGQAGSANFPWQILVLVLGGFAFAAAFFKRKQA